MARAVLRSKLSRVLVRLASPALLVLAAAPALAGVNRWTPFGPTGGAVDDVLLDPRSPARQWIAAGGTVYESEDSGTSWRLSSAGLEGQVTRWLAADPGQPDVLYAATDYPSTDGTSPGVFRSQDGGAHWQRVAGGEDFLFIWSLAVAPGPPGAPGVVFVGTDLKLLRSIDGGASFQAVISLTSVEIFEAVAPDPGTPGVVYTATLNHRSKSTDYGATWTGLDETPGRFPPFVHDLVVAPGDPRTLYETGFGANVGATWRSRDGGATWEGPFPFRGDVLAVDPHDASTVYGGSILGLFVSRDGGETFAPARGVPPLSIDVSGYYGVQALAVDPARPGYAVAATGQGLFTTVDRGRGWQSPEQRGLTANPVDNVRIDRYDPAHWILRSMGRYLQTRDGGLTFSPVADPLNALRIYALELDPFVRHRLWALGYNPSSTSYRLYVSNDGGTTWVAGGDAPTAGSHLLVPAPRVLLLAGNGIFRSQDSGHTWRMVERGVIGDPDSEDAYYLSFQSLVQDPRNVRIVYALGNAIRPHAGGFAAIYRSDDAGRTWRLWHQGGQAVGFDPFHPRAVHVVQGNDLLITRDGGATFQPAGNFGSAGTPWVLELLFDRVRRGVLYAATYANGFLRSRDGGATWEPLNSGLPAPLPIRNAAPSLVQDPVRSQRFYAAPSSGGLYRSDFTDQPR